MANGLHGPVGVGALGSNPSANGPQPLEVLNAIMTDLSKGLDANQSPTHGQRDEAPSGGGLGRRHSESGLQFGTGPDDRRWRPLYSVVTSSGYPV